MQEVVMHTRSLVSSLATPLVATPALTAVLDRLGN